jgi:hypothetical protein
MWVLPTSIHRAKKSLPSLNLNRLTSMKTSLATHRKFPMKRFNHVEGKNLPIAGDSTRAKIAFLSASGRSEFDRVAVNLSWTLQMRPHGQRFVRQGLFTVSRERSSGGRKNTTYLTMTPKGRDELKRLKRRYKLAN